jgi:aspartate aminotransferase-like enzyme
MQLDRIMAEGLENRFARHSQMAALVQNWVSANGFEVFAEGGYRSQTVTAVSNTMDLDIGELNEFLIKKQMRIANGYGQLKEKTFRIAHMGDTQIEEINTLLSTLDEFITRYQKSSKS